MSPSIAVVILAWNNYDDTRECIESILGQGLVETDVFLVDNGSRLEPLADLPHQFPEINYIRSDRNLGFAAGTNLGLREALATESEYILIINNDTRADEFMLHELLKALKDEDVGLTAPVIYYYDDPDKVWSSGGAMNNLFLMPLESHSTKNILDCPTERTFVSGCCYLLKRELLEQVGLFDERFFLYFEDLDFCKRINETFWKMKVVPAAKLFHKVAQSSGGQFSERERFYYALSSGLYYRKHIQPINAIPIILFRLGNALKMTVTLLLRGDSRVLKSYWNGLYQGWFGKKLQQDKKPSSPD